MKKAQARARVILRDEIFGDEDDWGELLLELVAWHFSRPWELDHLGESDKKRITALESLTVLTRIRFKGVHTSPPLDLSLARRSPLLGTLMYAMVAKMPVITVRFYLDLHVAFAFNSIRRANHPHADDLIAFLYDLLFLQQKVATSLLEFVRQAATTVMHKGDAQLIAAEIDAVMSAELVFASLKASIEKTIAMVGLVFGIPGLDSKKDHKSRLRALRAGLPPGVENLFYAEMLFDFVSSENLEDLNAFRAGLLHKKGIADLQPHQYVGVDPADLPFIRVFSVMHEQHARNTAVLVLALALLTDDLVTRDPPDFAFNDLPRELLISDLRTRMGSTPKNDET